MQLLSFLLLFLVGLHCSSYDLNRKNVATSIQPKHTNSLQISQIHKSTEKLILSSLIVSSVFLPRKSIAEETIITRSDVGFIDLNQTMPKVTDICFFDVQIGDSEPQRIEISLFGEVVPKTVQNFKSLCLNENGIGYKNSNFFRIISQFSVQGGNIGNDETILPSKINKYGKAADGISFPPENYRILHSYTNAGVISMMKDIINKGYQDSRFFITVSPDASWADEKYTAFGLVTKGMNLIQGMTVIPVERPTNYPQTKIKIVDSGIL